MLGAIIQRIDKILELFSNDLAAYFTRPGQFAIISVKFFVQDQKPVDLAARKHIIDGHLSIDLLDIALYRVQHLRMPGQFLI